MQGGGWGGEVYIMSTQTEISGQTVVISKYKSEARLSVCYNDKPVFL